MLAELDSCTDGKVAIGCAIELESWSQWRFGAAVPAGVAVQASDPHILAFDLPPPAVRVFHKAVQCIGKLGREIALIFRPDELVLHATDDTRSWIMQFALRRRFFRTLPGNLAFRGKPDEQATAVVPAKSLLVAVRGAQQRADNLVIGLCDAEAVVGGLGGEGEMRLGLEFTARFGAQVRHRIPLLDVDMPLPRDPPSGPHAVALTPNLVSRVMDHCSPPTSRSSSCDEVTLGAVPDGLRILSVDLLRRGGPGNRHGGSHPKE